MIHKTDNVLITLSFLKKYVGYYYYVDLITNSKKAIIVQNPYPEFIRFYVTSKVVIRTLSKM